MMSSKGYIYTVTSLIFALVLLALVSLYYESYQNAAKINPTQIRTDELHYFIESSKKDVSRAMSISGRRGVVYLTDYITSEKKPLNDSQASIKELILNGTLTNVTQKVNVSGMQNHTLSDWLAGARETGRRQNFIVNISFEALDIYAFDAWHFLEVLTIDYNVSDKGNSCRYEGKGLKIYSLISIEGLEDVYYPLNTGNRIKRYYQESENTQTTEVLATGIRGNGTGGGIVYDISNSTNPDNNVSNYSSTYPELVNYTVFVMNLTDYYTGLSEGSKSILNNSGGLVNYKNISVNRTGFAYIVGVPRMDFSNIGAIVVRNGVKSEIIWLKVNLEIEQGLYHTSAQGPTFFDRLEGKSNATFKYRNQSSYIRNLFGLEPGAEAGLESFVNVTEFTVNRLYDLGILKPFKNQSSVDYMYFNNLSGVWVYGTPAWFRLNSTGITKYNLTDYKYDPSLVAWFNFDEGAGDVIYDNSRKGNNLVRIGMRWVSGKRGTGLEYNGSAKYLTARLPLDMPAGNKTTVTAWIKPYTLQYDTDHNSIASWGPRTCTGTSFSLGIQSSGRPGFSTWCNDFKPSSGPAVTFNQWTFIAAVLNSQSIKLYVNNQSISGTMPSSVSIQNGALNIDSADDPGRGFNGVIDEVRIWNRALSNEEILEEYERVK